MLAAFLVWTKKRNNQTRAQAHSDHNVDTPFWQIQPNDTAGMQRDGVETDRRKAGREHRRGGKPIHIHQRGTFWLTPSEHIISYKRPKPVRHQYYLCCMSQSAFWLCYSSSMVSKDQVQLDSCIHKLFLIISPHGPAGFSSALNWNNL